MNIRGRLKIILLTGEAAKQPNHLLLRHLQTPLIPMNYKINIIKVTYQICSKTSFPLFPACLIRKSCAQTRIDIIVLKLSKHDSLHVAELNPSSQFQKEIFGSNELAFLES